MVADRFILVAFSSPEHVDDESRKLKYLISSGFDYIHLRKPSADISEIERLLSTFSDNELRHIRIHDHFSLIEKYPLAGVHLNSRNRSCNLKTASITKSLHSIEETLHTEELEYFTLSPIYPSISKAGYKADFDLREVSKVINGRKCVALGGITPDRIPQLRSLGFFGAAFLGYLWNHDFRRNVEEIVKYKNR